MVAVGNMTEWFDYGVYAYTAVHLGEVFFPGDDPTASTLGSLLVFAVSFLVRPLGGLVWGPLVTSSAGSGCSPPRSSSWRAPPSASASSPGTRPSECSRPPGSSCCGWSRASPRAASTVAPRPSRPSTHPTTGGGDSAASWSSARSGPRWCSSPSWSSGRTRWPTGAGDCRSSSPRRSGWSGSACGHGSRTPPSSGRPRPRGRSTGTYLESELGLSSRASLVLIIVGQVAMTAVIPFAGAWSDRVGRKTLWWISIVGLFVLAIPLFTLMGTGFAAGGRRVRRARAAVRAAARHRLGHVPRDVPDPRPLRRVRHRVQPVHVGLRRHGARREPGARQRERGTSWYPPTT